MKCMHEDQGHPQGHSELLETAPNREKDKQKYKTGSIHTGEGTGLNFPAGFSQPKHLGSKEPPAIVSQVPEL